MTPLTLTHGRRDDGTPVVTVDGEIDMSNAELLGDALSAYPGRVVVDLTAVGYLDSAGLNTLFPHAERLELLAPSLLLPVLTISGLAALCGVHETGPA